ncbi:DUF1127 domain-containing protein [Shimia sp.]|uniref:DUF1127 domain-containing protein n=1 Tax=Shimia sp. TaxID=1954381 RepID=UPI003299915C
MAHTATQAVHHRSLASTLAAPFVTFGNWLIAIGEKDSRYRRAQFLASLTDEQLAVRGLKREDIAREAFGASFHV